VVQNPEFQYAKKYQDTPSNLPDNSLIKTHIAEVLRLVEAANVFKGGWVGGDAWFGSVVSCVEIYERLNVHSMFICQQ